jgi:hypothetical protein
MKHFNALLFGLLMLGIGTLSAQNDVKFEIRHFLGGTPFALNMAAQNNMENDFNVTRLEYYISQIDIAHDGGQVTRIDSFWLLVNAKDPLLADLGTYNIDQVESISFYIGVEQPFNHLDPAQYPLSHPLAPKAPSMHWGWASGYRFLAIEGFAGSNLGQLYQLHGLGNENYYQTQVDSPTVTATPNGMVISLDADYAGILHNIDVSSGLIVHGSADEASQALGNMPAYVFSPASATTSVDDQLAAPAFRLYPNPTSSGYTFLKLEEPAFESLQVQLLDMTGKKLFETSLQPGTAEVRIPVGEAGFYLLSLMQENKMMETRKLIVK